jgi:hypothetical protein
MTVKATDRDDANQLTDDAIERCFGAARAAYFDLCRAVRVDGSEIGEVAIQRGSAEVGPEVSVSAAVIELFPEGFTMAGRVRGDNDAIAADTRCFVTVAGGVSDTIRDELIAIAHSAKHWH